MTLYPLADRHPSNFPRNSLMARKAGEYRPPKQGEWYLSGAIPEAYLAPNDLSTPYLILKIVRVRRVVQTIIEEEL